MKLGLPTPIVMQLPGAAGGWEATAGPGELTRVAEAAERLGYAHLTCSEHVAVPESRSAGRGLTYWDPLERMVVGEVVNTAYLTRGVLDLADPDGLTVVNVGSGAGGHVPRRPVGQGGWAFSYSATKAALHRLAPFLQLEWGGRGIRAFTVDPGFTRTEALLERLGDIPGSSPPALPAEVIAWLACDPSCDAEPGSYLTAPAVAAEKGWNF